MSPCYDRFLSLITMKGAQESMDTASFLQKLSPSPIN